MFIISRNQENPAICIRRNANGAMPLRLALGLGLGWGIGLGVGLGSGFDYFRHCAICIAPNTKSQKIRLGLCECIDAQLLWSAKIEYSLELGKVFRFTFQENSAWMQFW